MADALIERARALLKLAESRGISLREIEKKTGLKTAWLSLFKLGKIPNPGVLTIRDVISKLETLLA